MPRLTVVCGVIADGKADTHVRISRELQAAMNFCMGRPLDNQRDTNTARITRGIHAATLDYCSNHFGEGFGGIFSILIIPQK
jgi:hypothetical protein